MNYDDFRAAFLGALKRSHIPTIGSAPSEETLDLRTMTRELVVNLEPIEREIGTPFHVTAKVSFQWDALHTARSVTSEADMIRQVVVPNGQDIEAAPPLLRVGIRLRASLMADSSIAMPTADRWKSWHEAARARLVEIESLVSDAVARDPNDELITLQEWAIWPGWPEIGVSWVPEPGEVRLNSLEVSGSQGIEFPRGPSDAAQELALLLDAVLATLFLRVEKALHAWGEILDELR